MLAVEGVTAGVNATDWPSAREEPGLAVKLTANEPVAGGIVALISLE